MSKLRYLKSPEELQAAAENNLEFFDAKMQAVKVFYKTTPGLVEQLIPSPLQPADDPIVRVVMSRVFVDLHDGLEFGAATFGVNCKYKDIDGIYEITMPMEGEGVVVGGRETYGEPKKTSWVNHPLCSLGFFRVLPPLIDHQVIMVLLKHSLTYCTALLKILSLIHI